MKWARGAFRDRLNIAAAVVVVALVALSLIAQQSAQFYAGGEYYERQTIWIVVGGAVLVIAAMLDLRLVERGSYLFYAACIGLLVLTLVVGGGSDAQGVQFRRWIHMGGFNIQASELTKLGVILALARYLHRRKERNPGETESVATRFSFRDLLVPALIVCLPIPLILLQPDLGTALMLVFIGATMLLMEGVQRRAVTVIAAVLLIAIPVAWSSGLIQDYQKDRVYKLVDKNWEKVDEHGVLHEKRRTQVEQSVWAIGTGGFAGQGRHGANKTRMNALPEIHSDFIAAPVAEEYGFVGVLVIIVLFWGLVMWSLRTAHDARSRYCRLIAVGVAALLGWQVFINLGMISEMLPVVGLPLPFLSYGGSAMFMLMAALGVIFNIAFSRGRL